MNSNATEPSAPQTCSLREITSFPTVIHHPEHGQIRIVGYKRPYEYMGGIYAFEDVESGEYSGMIVEDNTEVTILDK